MTEVAGMTRVVAVISLLALLGLGGFAQPVPAQTGERPQLPADIPAEAARHIESFSFRGPVQERRFHGLLGNMRCLEDPSKSLLESTAPQANEMRAAVFRMLQDDRADFEIRLAMVDLYGDDVLYQSAFAGHRLLIWFGPVILLVIGLIAAFLVSMKKRRAA